MQAFNYDPTTGRYLGATPADPDPQQPGEFLLPAFSTPKAPPQAPAGRVAVFDPKADAWTLQELPAAPPPPMPAPELDAARSALLLRGELLRASDVVVLRAYEAGVPVSDEWKAYRQALRDVPAQEGFPDSINWPKAPAV